ncbi:MAG: hypothetical protein ACRCZZ_04875 [Phocaeicola sp.]
MEEKSRNDIKKAAIKKDRLNVTYNERFLENNCTNVVTKNCDQIIHMDLKAAFDRMKLHLIFLTEQPEAERITMESFSSPGFAETFPNYFINGYGNDSVDGVKGITILGTKLLQSGKTVDLKIFAAFEDDAYEFRHELSIDANACDEEVTAYLFEEKYSLKQERLDFECDAPEDATMDEAPKKKKGRKPRTNISVVTFDTTA